MTWQSSVPHASRGMLSILLMLSCGQSISVTKNVPANTCFVYPAYTNYVLGSSGLSGGYWFATNGHGSYGCAIVGSGPAPECAYSWNAVGCSLTKATRFTCPAVTSGELDIYYQDSACPAGTKSGGIWCASASGTVTMDFQVGGSCKTCTCTTTPTRCILEDAKAGDRIAVGNQSGTNGCAGGPRGSLDVQVWQADCQNTVRLAPPLVTGAATVSKAAGCGQTITKIVAGLGDSITLASGTGVDPLPVRLANTLGPEWGWIQGGVAGDTCADVLARWPTIKAANPGITHVAIMCGVNDARTGRSAAQAWADEQSIIDDALTRGYKVRLIRTLNFKNNSEANPAKVQMINDLNTLQQAWCDSHSLACASPETTMEVADVLINHQGDFLHPDTTGTAQLNTAITSWPQRTAEGW